MVLYNDDRRLRGYLTGLALFNEFGPSIQLPHIITIALNGGRQEKDFATMRARMARAKAPVREKNVKLLQYLGMLHDLKRIPDTDTNRALKLIVRGMPSLMVANAGGWPTRPRTTTQRKYVR